MSAEYKMTELGELPESWKVKELKDLCSKNKYAIVDGPFGSNLKTIHYRTNGIPIISSGFVTNGHFFAKEYLYVDKELFEREKRSSVKAGDIVMAKIGARCGACAILPLNHETSILSGNALKISFDDNVNCTSFYFQILSVYAKDGTLDKIKTTGAQPAISISSLKKLKFVNPPLSEQQKIAEILSTVDEKIAVIEEQIKETEALKKGLMQQLLTKGIGHTKFKDSPLGEIPESWEVVKIEDLITTQSIISHLDGNHGELYPKASEFTEEGIPYVSANSFVNGKVDFSLCKKLPEARASLFRKGVAKNGDILFAHNATVGPVAYLETDFDYVILSTTATYYRVDNKTIDSKYWMYFLSSRHFINQYSKVMGQSTRNQVPITMQRSFLSVLPDFNEQRKIGEILNTVDEKLEVLLKRKDSFQELKKGLMQQLLTGKIRVQLN